MAASDVDTHQLMHNRHHPQRVSRPVAQGREWRLACSLLFALTTLSAPATWAEDQGGKLRHIKAAFVLNIAKFVTWPQEVYQQRPSTLQLCHYRRDALGSAYDSIRQRKVDGRQLNASLRQDLHTSDSCDILLVPAQELDLLARETAQGFQKPVLTIADLTSQEAQGIAYPGVLLALVRDGTRIGFEINLEATHRRGLQFSSQLLKLAKIVNLSNDGAGARPAQLTRDEES